MARYTEMKQVCPMAGLLTNLARPWTLHILWTLREGEEVRFGALRRDIHGISARMLTQRLRQLEKDGFVCRRVVEASTQEVYYSISEKMQAIQKVLDDLEQLALQL